MREGWTVCPLADLIFQTGAIDPTKTPFKKFQYVDVSSVSNETFIIGQTSEMLGRDAPSRARRQIKSGDVIFATIRPTLKRIAMVPPDLDGEVCSTAYFVFRARPALSPRFLFYYLFTDEFMEAMGRLQTGASYPAVNDTQVKSQAIAVPGLSEQKRIVAILDEAFEGIDSAVANTEKNLANARELFETTIVTGLFGDPVARGWRTTTVEKVAAAGKGSIRTGPFGSQLLHGEFVDKGIAVLGIDNAVMNEFQWAKRRFITPEKYAELTRYTVRPGDVLITIMGTCGRCAVVPDDIPLAINTKHLCCITLNKEQCLPQFLHAYFLYHPVARAFLALRAKGSIMEGLNMGIIRELPVWLPSLPIQTEVLSKFKILAASIQALQSVYEQKLGALSALKRALLRKAFAGELTAEPGQALPEAAE